MEPRPTPHGGGPPWPPWLPHPHLRNAERDSPHPALFRGGRGIVSRALSCTVTSTKGHIFPEKGVEWFSLYCTGGCQCA